MRKYERIQRRRALVKTIIGCVGWGVLGYILMTSYAFWPGWLILSISVCVGAYSIDKFLVTEWGIGV